VRAAEQYGATIHVAAPGGELASWLRNGRAGAALIRPDRAVLRCGRDADEVTGLLGRYLVAVDENQGSGVQ
jgi:3-(3-hydroxy-phenyl)propionate hydroxylase